MSLLGRDLISLDEYSVEEIVCILDLAEKMAKELAGEEKSWEPLDRILATCFYERKFRPGFETSRSKDERFPC